MTGPVHGIPLYLLLTLHAPPNMLGEGRRAILAIDCQSGEVVGIERYSPRGQITDETAAQDLTTRLRMPPDRVTQGPTLLIPSRQLYDLTDQMAGRTVRRAL